MFQPHSSFQQAQKIVNEMSKKHDLSETVKTRLTSEIADEILIAKIWNSKEVSL